MEQQTIGGTNTIIIIDFPVKVKDITKSEKQNSNIPKVNVLLMKKIKSTH